MSKPHQKYKTLTKIQSIEFLELLRDFDIKKACLVLELNVEEGKYYKRKFDAYNNDSIRGAINKLESQLSGSLGNYPHRDYKKQEECEHKDFTIFLKCKCSKVLSENDLDDIIAICQKKKESFKNNIITVSIESNLIT